nr:hypothetical protein CFP56_77328 [Quercus suber]
MRSQSQAAGSTPSDQKPREAKGAPYRDVRYETLLATKGVSLRKSPDGIKQECKVLCKDLLNSDQITPEQSRFSEHVFESTCRRSEGRNEAKVVQDVSRLIVPSVEKFAVFGAAHLDKLVESVNEGWNKSVPITGTRPQPDYAVGFGRGAFTQKQLNLMQPMVGDPFDQSYFMATNYMYFPFLTCEAKCGAAALDVADRQNAHSTAIAVRSVVELFRAVRREKELHQEILAFSISHDHCSVRIYGYYAEFEGAETKYYRHTIHKFDFTALDGKEKWTAYKFTKNLYDRWMPVHFKRICSAIDQIPANISFAVSESGDNTRSSEIHYGVATPSTSANEGEASKRPRRKHA